MKLWVKIRVHVLLALCGVASTMHAWNDGRKAGVQQKIGGPGEFRTAIVEWQDFNTKKVVLYLNDGANGYAFWMKLDPGFLHYTAAAKVFVCDNEDPVDMKEKLDWAREWCREDKEGHDSRIIGGELKPRADDDEAPAGLDERDWHAIQYDRECLEQARKDISQLALERDLLRSRLEKYESLSR
jgi:hypothetical protein